MADSLISFFAGQNLSLWSVSAMGITDVIDILLVAYVIYKVVEWIQQTRAWSLFKGIAIILLVMGLSMVLRLNTTYWIVSNTFNVGLIAIMVIFQPELRKALEQIGKGQLVSFFSVATTEQQNQKISKNTITEIIEAAKEMAKVRTGAIIVVERNVALGDHEQTGIAIDAVVTRQLLINIFEDKTPLHDGAVLIRNNRIAAASCILPLTAEEIGKELGTRHRAAVGTSEVSDACVLIVSEETGKISMAQGGKIYRGVTEQQILNSLLRNREIDKKRKIALWKGRSSDDKAR